MSRKQIRVRLRGGPKHGWAYNMPLHWEVVPGLTDVIWLPPNEIVAPTGQYVPAWPGLVSPERAAAVMSLVAEVGYEWQASDSPEKTT